MEPPSPQNHYHADHVALLCTSFRTLLGRDLTDPALDQAAAAAAIYHAPYVVVSHGTEADPIFNYANQAALELFELSWEAFTALPSRQSAEPPNRQERATLLAAVSRQGYIEHYSGVRIASSGRRFVIKDVTVWNLVDETGLYRGQGAVYSQWSALP